MVALMPNDSATRMLADIEEQLRGLGDDVTVLVHRFLRTNHMCGIQFSDRDL